MHKTEAVDTFTGSVWLCTQQSWPDTQELVLVSQVAFKRVRMRQFKRGICFSTLREVATLRDFPHANVINLLDIVRGGENSSVPQPPLLTSSSLIPLKLPHCYLTARAHMQASSLTCKCMDVPLSVCLCVHCRWRHGGRATRGSIRVPGAGVRRQGPLQAAWAQRVSGMTTNL